MIPLFGLLIILFFAVLKMTETAIYLGRLLFWRCKQPEYLHPLPDAAVAIAEESLPALLVGNVRIPASPGTTLIAVVGADGRPVREILITLDP